MLRHTFCHLPGVGEKTERQLWKAGLTTWETVLAQEGIRARPAPARRLPADLLRASVEEHARGCVGWFAPRLPASESWRLFADFRSRCAYLDIETTGMDFHDQITTLALYGEGVVRTYVQGRNLDAFVRDVARFDVLITYNGKSFDVPFIERCLGCRLPQAHIDLRYVLAGLGVRGGLKSCERQLGVARPGLEDVDGSVAVLLWRDYQQRKNPQALESLLAYNVQDAVNLEAIMVHAFNRKLETLGEPSFAVGQRLRAPAVPDNPHRPDPDTVRRLLREHPYLFATTTTGS